MKLSFNLNLPQNFQAHNKEFDIFKNCKIQTYLKPKINIFKNVRVSNNSVVFNYFKIFKESCIGEENYQKYKKNYKFYLKFIFPQFNFSKKRFILITDEWTTNYYHWHIFALGRLATLKVNNLLKDSVLILPKKYSKYEFALSSIEKFGLKKDQIKFLRRKSNIKVKKLSFVITSQQDQKTAQIIQKTLLENTTNIDLGYGDKIYISRQGQVLRFVENEEETIQLLTKYGFKKVIMEKFSYDEQINICRNTKYIVAPHGAGLTNILFMSKNSALLEMASKPYPYKPVTDYYQLAQMLDINYYYQECQASGKIADFHHGSLIVDLAKLEENLKLMLKNDSSKN